MPDEDRDEVPVNILSVAMDVVVGDCLQRISSFTLLRNCGISVSGRILSCPTESGRMLPDMLKAMCWFRGDKYAIAGSLIVLLSLTSLTMTLLVRSSVPFDSCCCFRLLYRMGDTTLTPPADLTCKSIRCRGPGRDITRGWEVGNWVTRRQSRDTLRPHSSKWYERRCEPESDPSPVPTATSPSACFP